MSELVNTFVEVKLVDESGFLKVKETLTRMGIASKKDNELFQSCHILHKQGKYYIVHFKELFALDGKQTDFSIEDKARRNTIATLLEDWDLLDIVNPKVVEEPKATLSNIKVIPFKEKNNWKLSAKYNIGKIKKSA